MPVTRQDAAVTLAFDGEGEGRTPLTWGQRTMWEAIRWLGEDRHYFNLRRTVRVPGLPVEAVVDVLATLVARHQALRTRFRDGPQGPEQHVHARGEQHLQVRRVRDAGTAPRVAEELTATLGARPFEAGEWSWRCALVLAGPRVEYLSLVLDHQAFDGFAAGLLLDQLRALLAGGTAQDALPEPAWQPLDQAADEAGGEGARRGELSLRHWRRQLATIPPTMFDVPGRVPEDRPFWKLGMTSPAAAAAATRIAARTGRTTSAVLLTAVCVVLSRLTGHTTCALQLIVANRFDERRRSMLSVLVEDGLFVLDLDTAATFDELVERTFRAALSTYRYGYYDRAARDGLIREASAARGVPVKVSCYFNDARFADDWTGVPEARTAEDLRQLSTWTELEVVGTWARQDSTFFVAANEQAGACRLTLLMDTRYLSVPQTEEALLAVERVLVAAALGDVPLPEAARATRVKPIDRPAAAPAGGTG